MVVLPLSKVVVKTSLCKSGIVYHRDLKRIKKILHFTFRRAKLLLCVLYSGNLPSRIKTVV